MYCNFNARNINGESLWKNTKDFINSLEDNEEFTRKQLLHHLYVDERIVRYETSADIYRNYLTHGEFLEWVSRGRYRKIDYIPENLKTTDIKKFINDTSWRTWFMPREDRLKLLRKKK